MSSSDVTAIDNYCGAGGSTTGLKAAGIRVVHAANHWQLAIQTHNTNHPDVDHSHVDLNLAHPGWFPKTTIAWFSPECTTHSPAGGRRRRHQNQLDLFDMKPPDPGVERSRMGAWDVVNFTEYHKYQAVIVENVCEFSEWSLFDNWLNAMATLGYEYQIVCFNSRFSYPNLVPQRRDRIYVVFSRKGNRRPDVAFTPPAICVEHGQINAVQAWKPHVVRKIGKYGPRNQYVYVCPHCGVEVIPSSRPAREALDWSLPMVRIGDRESLGLKPLSENTLRRIKVGLERFVLPLLQDDPFFVHRGYSTAPDHDRVLPIDEPAPTQTTSAKLYLAQPFIDSARTHNIPKPVDEPAPTLTTGRNLSVIAPPLIGVYHGGRDAIGLAEDPSPTIATNNQLHLVQPFISSYYGNGGQSLINEPAPTIRTRQGHALIQPDLSTLVDDCGYRMITAHEAKVLMGFDAGYVILGNQDQQFRQAGNAVTPPVAEMIGRAVLKSLS